jgi:pentose-5-phosphate-3-epimerase
VPLSGSLISLTETSRTAAAEELHRAGCWVHLDVIDGPFGARPSIGLDHINEIVRHGTGPVDIHLMVGDVAGWIDRLPVGCARITVQVTTADYTLAADWPWLPAARTRAAEVWIAIDPVADGLEEILTKASASALLRGTDGLLVMLVPPGQAGFALDDTRLRFVSTARTIPDVRVGVDGGVDVSNLEEIVARGATYVVSGRGLVDTEATAESTSAERHQ